jgi:hypothetical protein
VFNATDEQINELKNTCSWMAERCDIGTYSRTFEGFKPFELDKVERNIKMIEDNKYTATEINQNQKDLKEFFTEHDKRRDQNFVETFTELKNWYENIK